MKKFINDPTSVVHDYLVGLDAAHKDILHYDQRNRILLRSGDRKAGKVGLVAGGGSGCEPTHTGFVGPGMLDAVAPGEIFTSPNPDQIIAATRAANSGAGVLHIIKNFTGEVMNFGMAEEILSFEDTALQSVLINDDVAVKDSPDTAGRRGLGATVMVERIAGAAAERGDNLESVASIADKVVKRARTFGVGLSSCTPPSRGKPIFDQPADEMDLGIGISGEPGRERVRMKSAREIAEMLVAEVIGDLNPPKGAKLLSLVNGLGGTPHHELYLLNGEIDRVLRQMGFETSRMLVGNFVTSLEQLGAALTLLDVSEEMLALWDSPVHTAALRWGM
jgi:phosphoenolpyruvate---glycerone phosphotransferase subunit DhaK